MTRILKDRVHLIRSMLAAIPVARELECEDAFIKVIERIRRNERKHMLSFSKDVAGRVSYAPNPKAAGNPEARVRTTLGRYIRSLGVPVTEISSKALECITSRVFGLIMSEILPGRFRLISGEEIVKAYRKGVGSRSCMCGLNSKLTKFYADNPAKVQMLLYGDDACQYGQGRALLWKTDENVYVLDRIYPNKGVHVDAMKSIASKRGWVYRISTALPPVPEEVTLSDHKQHWVSGLAWTEGAVPYLDTFTYAHAEKNGTLTLSNAATANTAWVATCTSGFMYLLADLRRSSPSTPANPSTVCACCGETVSSVVAVDGHALCGYCERYYAYQCAFCGRRHLEDAFSGGGSVLVRSLEGFPVRSCPACVQRLNLQITPSTEESEGLRESRTPASSNFGGVGSAIPNVGFEGTASATGPAS